MVKMNKYEKLFDATAYILYQNDKSMNYVKLIKELYFADREALKQKGFSITGDEYYSMKEGPVLSTLYYLIKGKYSNLEIQKAWNELFVTDIKTRSISIIKDNFYKKSLSPNEKKILDNYSSKFKDLTCEEVVNNYAHNPKICPEWEKPIGTRKRLRLETILHYLDFSPEEIKVAINENNYYANR